VTTLVMGEEQESRDSHNALLDYGQIEGCAQSLTKYMSFRAAQKSMGTPVNPACTSKLGHDVWCRRLLMHQVPMVGFGGSVDVAARLISTRRSPRSTGHKAHDQQPSTALLELTMIKPPYLDTQMCILVSITRRWRFLRACSIPEKAHTRTALLPVPYFPNQLITSSVLRRQVDLEQEDFSVPLATAWDLLPSRGQPAYSQKALNNPKHMAVVFAYV
jgi:hypothetical protein